MGCNTSQELEDFFNGDNKNFVIYLSAASGTITLTDDTFKIFLENQKTENYDYNFSAVVSQSSTRLKNTFTLTQAQSTSIKKGNYNVYYQWENTSPFKKTWSGGEVEVFEKVE